MASLKEIKSRIASVRNTLQITSAMKMVAAAKLHHAQQLIAGMTPYESHLHAILNHLLAVDASRQVRAADSGSGQPLASTWTQSSSRRVAVVAFSSSSSLCGGFNSNVIRHLTTLLQSLHDEGLNDADIDLYTVGRKVADAVRRQGLAVAQDLSTLSDHPSYEGMAALGESLLDDYRQGRVGRVLLVYNHYASTASQPSRTETFLPFAPTPSSVALHDAVSGTHTDDDTPIILEPDRDALLRTLLPRTLKLRLYTVLLDANAAEHAARTVAMQIASDNGEKLLGELTLEYNKSRQQKITAEILDIMGGMRE